MLLGVLVLLTFLRLGLFWSGQARGEDVWGRIVFAAAGLLLVVLSLDVVKYIAVARRRLARRPG